MKSFKSFNELVQNECRIEEILVNFEKYHAHTHQIRNYEKLHEHVHLVMDYALKLVNAHGLDAVLDSMIHDLIKVNSKIEQVETIGSFVKRLFVNALVYHDYGKVNENFQIDKMQDKAFFKRNENNTIGSQHSILSAYVFLNVHLKEIIENRNLSPSEANFLIVSTYLFANPILKHHSSFFEHQIDFDDEKVIALEPYLKLFDSKLTKGTNHLMVNISKVIDSELKKYKKDGSDYFSFYALLKLNFSLLTASDYYATNDFMGDMPVNDFGLIDNNFKEQLFDNFINNEKADYNGKLYERFDYYNQLNFSKLQEQNNKNLNQLRQKMAAEAITTLRQNIDKKLFYLEAPTGGGKTNMSFACALELLKSDERLNKVFYVFPFTTLITQTFKSIKETLKIDNDKVIQLHSKGGFHTSEKEENQDGLYGNKKLNYINNLFINYPFTLLSHIKFFNVLKGNGKDANYILHRMSNSVVIIDELQTYTPKHWDKIIFFLHHYSKHFNIRFIIMSATLPKIDKLSKEAIGKVQPLIPNKHEYFTNPNFKGRVTFDFSLLGKSGRETIKLEDLLDVVYQELEKYAGNNDNSANGLIEFIIKKSASKFYQLVDNDNRFDDYQKFLISGTILEPRRQEIIEAIKKKIYQDKPFKKSIIITTQVIEAGVDIDMDIGFKDRSLVDSDEQLAGRVNRNASKNDCKVFIFNYDREVKIYGKDKRYEQKLTFPIYKNILETKDFDLLYDKVNYGINKLNESKIYENIKEYLDNFKKFDFRKINEEFKLIDTNTTSVFVPLDIDRKWFSKSEREFLDAFDYDFSKNISGEKVFEIYQKIIEAQQGFIEKMIDKKQIGGIMSKFMFSIFTDSKLEQELKSYYDMPIFEQFGLLYLLNWEKIYSLKSGIDDSKFETDIFL
jgi:CRISPR-associated endonuclease/helicase Cas3